jgi:threonylcarbamoyladenosine tRNA methylthiotransferase MtaB
VVFGADIIAGFPTETDEMFANTLALVDEAQLTYLHVFPYSARSGTPAAKMPQVAKEIRKARAAQLRETGSRQLASFLQLQVGTKVQVLVEHNECRTEHFAPIKLDSELTAGTMVQAVVNSADATTLYGTITQ